MGSPGGLAVTALDTDAASKPPIELYLVRLSPTCRIVWLYMLQVGEKIMPGSHKKFGDRIAPLASILGGAINSRQFCFREEFIQYP